MNNKTFKRNEFNKILKQFIFNMKLKFPDSMEFKNAEKYINDNTINIFMNHTKPYETFILSKNPNLLLKADFCKKLNLLKYYNKCDNEDKENIWSYVQTLYFLGCAYENYSQEIIKLLYNVSKKCEETFES